MPYYILYILDFIQYIAKAIPFIYSFPGICASLANFYIHVSVSNLYIPRIDPHIFSSRNGSSIVGIYNSLTDTWMWKLGLRPRYSFSGNICFQFSAFFLCSEECINPLSYQRRWKQYLPVSLPISILLSLWFCQCLLFSVCLYRCVLVCIPVASEPALYTVCTVICICSKLIQTLLDVVSVFQFRLLKILETNMEVYSNPLLLMSAKCVF